VTTRPWPKARTIVCASAPDVPHGVGHNRVCVCHCQWCTAERAGMATDAPPQFTLDLQEAA